MVKTGSIALNETRAKNVALSSYRSEHEIMCVLAKHRDEIQDYAYILHDHDLKDNGEPETNHFHIVLHFFGRKTVKQVREWFYDSSLFSDHVNTLGQIVGNLPGILDYLTHCNQPEKYPYNFQDIVTNNPEWLSQPEKIDVDSKSYQIVLDILDEIPVRDLCKRYGREFIIHYKHYLEVAYLISQNERTCENDT